MTINTSRTLWVTSVSPREIQGKKAVPTAIHYTNESTTVIGNRAISLREDDQTVNTEFKIDLGDVTPGVVSGRQRFETGSGLKSAYEISNDFVTGILSVVENELDLISEDTPKIAAKIMVAEPLSFQVENHSKNWLANYRSNFRRILSRYEEVDFLPEPFAVYQYYRYGLRVPRLLDQTKQIALIIDFGGGTFDTCVIESTNLGDISIKGKHSKPLAAKSIPVGGFFVNRRLALYVCKRDADRADKNKIDHYYKQYERVIRGDLSRFDLKQECQDFICNFEGLEQRFEQHKLELTSRITTWGLEDEAYEKIIVQRPKDPLKLGQWVDTEFYSHQFRQIFVNEIWSNRLKQVIQGVLNIASEALDGRSITTTLISGGSSNIRWLENLITRDFSESLNQAHPVPINHSFQEVVANGLTIECARRYYSEEHADDSEFMAVTYNPIKLYLGSDGSELVRDYMFRSIKDRVDMGAAKPGDLIPSAQSLRHFFGQHLQWRIKLKRPPKQFLDYLFSRPSQSRSPARPTEDIFDGAFNLEHRRLTTSAKKFDSAIHIDLEVRSDGTTTPKFIYQAANPRGGIAENAVAGRSFFIDMTTQSESSVTKIRQYVGFDFGTSSSAVCTLNEKEIRLTEARAASSDWKSVNDSLQALPYPVAISVRRYLSRHSNEVAAAREAFESGLAFMAYVTAAEACHLGCVDGELKSFPHRAMSPLWALFVNCQRRLGKKGIFSKEFSRVLENPSEVSLFKEAIDSFTLNKHGKLADSAKDWHRYVQLPLRAIVTGLKGIEFGRSMICTPVPFGVGKHKGTFVFAKDNQPFVNTMKFESDGSIDGSLALLVDRHSGKTLSLFPFVFWFDQNFSGIQECYFLDRISSKGAGATVKPSDRDEEVVAKDLSPELELAIKSLLNAKVTRSVGELEIRFLDEENEP